MKKVRLVSVVYAFSLICMAVVFVSRFMNRGVQVGDMSISFFIICFGTWGYFTLCSKYMKEKGADR